jgi:hypothetical protein
MTSGECFENKCFYEIYKKFVWPLNVYHVPRHDFLYINWQGMQPFPLYTPNNM